jgi:hypothetical protein
MSEILTLLVHDYPSLKMVNWKTARSRQCILTARMRTDPLLGADIQNQKL